VYAQGNCEPGARQGDFFVIGFYGGIDDRYFNCGTLQGGTIQAKP
jgi:hypothetical protein